MPKARTSQAGWVRSVDPDQDVAIVAVMNETRDYETYMVPLGRIRARDITS